MKKVKHLGPIPNGAILVTADAVGLYPSIPHKAVLEALRRRLNKRETFEIPTEDIVQMAEFVLKNNFFEFNQEVKRQMSGTAIGTKSAPPYACIFMDEVETEFLKSQELQPFLWLCYIDDIFFIWTHGTQELDSFLNELNKFHPNLTFTYETLEERVNFLDLNVSIRNGAISTDLYIKPTDGHQYLHYKSSHPEHIKNSIPYSQALKLSGICSSEKDFKGHVDRMKVWFLARDYPENVVNEQINKVVFGKNQPSRKNSENAVPFVVTYHPKVKKLGKLIKDLLAFLYSDEEVQKVFSPPPMVSYRSARKIKDYLVGTKLYPLERNVGCEGCGNGRCQVCKNTKVTDTFGSFTTKKSYKINHRFDCYDKCLIYLFSCRTCGKQYTGKTTDRFRYRWNNYKMEAKKAENGHMENVKQEFLQSHILQDDHKGFLEDVEVRLIDKTQGSVPTKQEYYWMRTLKTLYPDGLNIESDY